MKKETLFKVTVRQALKRLKASEYGMGSILNCGGYIVQLNKKVKVFKQNRYPHNPTLVPVEKVPQYIKDFLSR